MQKEEKEVELVPVSEEVIREEYEAAYPKSAMAGRMGTTPEYLILQLRPMNPTLVLLHLSQYHRPRTSSAEPAWVDKLVCLLTAYKLAATLPHGGGGAFNNGRFSSDHTLGVSPGVLGSEGAHSNDKNVRKWPVHYTIYG